MSSLASPPTLSPGLPSFTPQLGFVRGAAAAVKELQPRSKTNKTIVLFDLGIPFQLGCEKSK
jgi:hypothetical protein